MTTDTTTLQIKKIIDNLINYPHKVTNPDYRLQAVMSEIVKIARILNTTEPTEQPPLLASILQQIANDSGQNHAAREAAKHLLSLSSVASLAQPTGDAAGEPVTNNRIVQHAEGGLYVHIGTAKAAGQAKDGAPIEVYRSMNDGRLWYRFPHDFEKRFTVYAAPKVKPKLPPLNDHMKAILGRMCFQCIHIAKLLRNDGQIIACRAEDEQAAVIYWLLNLYLEFGDAWSVQAGAKLGEIRERYE